jgi:hypothetical protein
MRASFSLFLAARAGEAEPSVLVIHFAFYVKAMAAGFQIDGHGIVAAARSLLIAACI